MLAPVWGTGTRGGSPPGAKVIPALVGGVLLGAPYEDSDFGSSISSSMVAERNSRSLGDDSAAYVVPDDATADILSTI
jgi:hypothetical protein